MRDVGWNIPYEIPLDQNHYVAAAGALRDEADSISRVGAADEQGSAGGVAGVAQQTGHATFTRKWKVPTPPSSSRTGTVTVKIPVAA
jgi:hypothetical protein